MEEDRLAGYRAVIGDDQPVLTAEEQVLHDMATKLNMPLLLEHIQVGDRVREWLTGRDPLGRKMIDKLLNDLYACMSAWAYSPDPTSQDVLTSHRTAQACILSLNTLEGFLSDESEVLLQADIRARERGPQ